MILERTIQMNNDKGLFAGPLSEFVEEANRFRHRIRVTYNGQTVDAKNMLAMLQLNIGGRSEFILTVEGPDPEEVADSLERLAHKRTGPPGPIPPWDI